jgi:hypothetical protein
LGWQDYFDESVYNKKFKKALIDDNQNAYMHEIKRSLNEIILSK